MKKLFFVLGLSLMTSGVFANENLEEKNTKKEDSSAAQVCCRRGASDASGQNVSVRACVDGTGDAQIDMGNACTKALNAAKATLTALQD
ncbi:MAG: hypothetical protein CVU07_00170 [Bacteroidetes bacterium HGW-Bacteroidetes-23]|nr:MAG: hypothetical protein CVU07_00170 [Bacteroidetes bacterium HGW-Bacteroidetes-23]